MIETSFRLTCTINGQEISRTIPPVLRLLDLLREELGLTGTKPGCEVGRCGSCMVLVDGEPMNACLMMAYQCEGRRVITIEGLSQEGPDPVQQSLLQEGGLQCGYCTPGMVVSLRALFDRNPSPNLEAIKEALSGNLCRCTGYEGILRAAAHLSEFNRKWTVTELNRLEKDLFVEVLGAVCEHTPSIAQEVWSRGPYSSREDLFNMFEQVILELDSNSQLHLLRAHPDLGARISMTRDSVVEQAGAGLDRLSPREYRYLSALNRLYKSKYGFPFIMAVRGCGKEEIMAAIRRRIRSEASLELEHALREVGRIVRLRLGELVREETRCPGE